MRRHHGTGQRTGHTHMVHHMAKARTQGAIPSRDGHRGHRGHHGGLIGHEERRARGYARAHAAGSIKRHTGLPGRRGHI